MKFLKYLILLVVVIVVALIATPFIFKNKIIKQVKQEANNQLNATLNWDSFDLTLIKTFPKLGLELNKLSIIGKDDFKNDTLIYLPQLILSLDIMSVVKGSNIQINKIVLDKPFINIIIQRNGNANYNITKPDSSKKKTTTTETKFKLALQEFKIIDGNIKYIDFQGNMKSVLKNINHTLTGDFTQDVFDIFSTTEIEKLSYEYNGINYLYNTKTGIDFDATIDSKNSKYTFKKNEFRLNALAFGLDGFIQMPDNDINLDLKFLAKKADFKEFLSLIPGVYTKDFANIKTSGKLAFDGFVKGTYNDGKKKMPSFAINLNVNNAYFQYPSLPKAVKNINIDAHVNNTNGSPDNTKIDIRNFHLEMAENPIDIKMLITNPISDPAIDGNVKGRIVLNSIKEFVPLEKDQKLSGIITADITMKGRKSMIDNKQYEQFKAAGKLSITNMDYQSKDTPYGIKINTCEMLFNPKTVDVKSFNALLGKNDIQATGKIDNLIAYMLRDDMLKGQFNATSNYMNINDFMSSEEPAPASKAADTLTGVVPVPHNLDFVITSAFKNVHYDKLDMQNVNGTLIIKESILTMQNISMNVLEGMFKLNGTYNTQNERTPKVNIDLQALDVNLPKTFEAFNTIKKIAPISKYTTGKITTTLTFKADLKPDMSPELSTLTCNGKLKTNNVLVKGTPTLIKLGETLKQESLKQLPLNNTDLSYEFENGKVKVKPFDIKFKNSKVNISGEQFFDQKINYVMNFDIPTSEFGSQANGILQGLLGKATGNGVNVPLGDKVNFNAIVGGTFLKPTITTDFKAMAKGLVNNLANQVKDKAKAELYKKKAELEAKAREEANKLKQKAQVEIDKKKAELEAKAREEAEKIRIEVEKKKKELEDKARIEAEKLKQKAKDKAKNLLNNVIKP